MLMIDLKIVLCDPHPVCPATFTYNRKTYRSLRIPFNPLYDIVKSIELNCTQPFFQETLQVLNSQKQEVSILAAEDVIRLADTYFKTRLRIDSEAFGNVLLWMVADGQSMDFLDAIGTESLVSGVVAALGKGVETDKVRKVLNEYLNETNRGDQDKKVIRSILGMKVEVGRTEVREVKEVAKRKESEGSTKGQVPASGSNKKEPVKSIGLELKDYKEKVREPAVSSAAAKIEQIPVSNKPIKKPNPPTKSAVKFAPSQAKQEVPKQQAKFDDDNRRDNLSRSQRKKWDEMVYLGINGDTNEGWRERNRPSKYQPRKYDKQGNSAHAAQEKKQPQPKIDKVFARPQCKLPVVFEYISKDQTFDFSKLQLPVQMNIQPENINIFLEPTSLTVMKGDKGFKRPTNYIYVENGLYAQGLTLLLHGVTNIEDGGSVINGATLEDIAPNSGWIIIQNMIIYQK